MKMLRERKGLKKLKKDEKQREKIYLEIHNSTIGVLKYLSKYSPVYTIQGNVGILYANNVREYRKR